METENDKKLASFLKDEEVKVVWKEDDKTKVGRGKIMNDDDNLADIAEMVSTEPDDLKPKKPTNRAPQGIRTFTVCRQSDETGISGEGVVIEGATFATGHTVIHWLTPAPRGSIAFFDAFDDFLKILVQIFEFPLKNK